MSELSVSTIASFDDEPTGRAYLVFPAAFLLAIVQSVALSRLDVFGANVDVALLFVIAWGMFRRLREALGVALMTGITLDAVSGTAFGYHTLAMTVVALSSGLTARNVFHNPLYLSLFGIIAGTLLHSTVFLLLLRLGGMGGGGTLALVRTFMPAVAANLLGGALVLPICRRVSGVQRASALPEPY